MAHVEKDIEVEAPISTVYNQWTQFESFPQFMEGVQEVRQLSDTALHWVAEIGGHTVEWDSTINRQEPDRCIAWRSSSGATNAGEVRFEELGPDRTRVLLRAEYEPQGLAEKAGAAMGVVSMRISGDLQRFKKFIEGRQRETGAWRGEIHGGHVTR